MLRPQFSGQDNFFAPVDDSYSLLPIRFEPLRDLKGLEGMYLVSNLTGEFHLMSRQDLDSLVKGLVPVHSPLYQDLKSKHFLVDSESSVAIDLLSVKYRTRFAQLPDLAQLHIFVITLRCNHTCRYCQVTRCLQDEVGFDMTEETCLAAVDFMFQSPSSYLKVEFQGGEPTLNFQGIKTVVAESERRARAENRQVEFVVCTNLADITEEFWAFFKEHKFLISTSLDGPRDLHNTNRVLTAGDSYGGLLANLQRAREVVGIDNVSALMTTTRSSLARPKEILDEYLRQGFFSIFLRPLNPYGFATRNNQDISYSVDEWLSFYSEALDYILEINRQGIPFREQYAALILKRMFTPFGHNYVDLQSPTGTGLGVLVYNYDGGIFPSDESRMLSAMGDDRFKFGELGNSKFEDVMFSDPFLDMVSETMLEGIPMCVDCGFQSYCGSDPIRHYRSQGDMVGYKPKSEFCQKQKGVIRMILSKMAESNENRAIFSKWI